MTDLADCPWCDDGGSPELHEGKHHTRWTYVRCADCNCQGPKIMSIDIEKEMNDDLSDLQAHRLARRATSHLVKVWWDDRSNR